MKPLVSRLTDPFNDKRTAQRVVFLMLAAILISGNRTVSAIIRLIGLIDRVSPSTYHRVVSHRRWHLAPLSQAIIGFLLERYLPSGIIRICGDDTVDGQRGKNVYRKARHRDAVRSNQSHTVYRYRHKWIVLAILIQFPGCSRPFALAVLVALYRDALNQMQRRW